VKSGFIFPIPEGLCRSLCLAPITLKACLCVQATTLSGFDALFGVSFPGGHSVLLQSVVLAVHGEKDAMFPKELNFKYFHGLWTISLYR
jgi:hypothetical protein